MFTWWYYTEIILTKVKSLKCNELISLLRSHNNLGSWTTPHFCVNDHEVLLDLNGFCFFLFTNRWWIVGFVHGYWYLIEDDGMNHLSRFRILNNLIHDFEIRIMRGLKFFGWFMWALVIYMFLIICVFNIFNLLVAINLYVVCSMSDVFVSCVNV
jgi:hypothetical protein